MQWTYKMKFVRIGLVFLAVFGVGKLYAQLDNYLLYDSINWQRGEENVLKFELNASPYFRNTEYFNTIELGRTLLGYQLHPQLSLALNGRVKLQGGLFVRRDFGSPEPYTDIQPTFSLKARQGDFSLIFGNLEGALSHRLPEPVYDINRYIEHRQEQGIQLKYANEQSLADLFIDWTRYINRQSNDQERFTVGLNLKQQLLDPYKSQRLIPSAFVVGSHKGGQIGTNSDPVVMEWNLGAGLRYEQGRKTQYGFVEFHYMLYRNPDQPVGLIPNKGSGLLGNLGVRLNHFTLSASIWNGNDFKSATGTPLYSSQSIDNAQDYEASRKLVFFRVMYEKALMKSPVLASFRFEPVMDLNQDIFDYSYSLYLVYRGAFTLNKNKR